jgi:hypothetical protein
MTTKQPEPDVSDGRVPASEWMMDYRFLLISQREPRPARHALAVSAPRQTKPMWAAEGRHCGLGIADWGFEEARRAGLVWTLRQTKPITLYVVVVVLLGHYICKVGSPGRKTKPIGRACPSPANPKSEARSPKQTQNPNAPMEVPGCRRCAKQSQSATFGYITLALRRGSRFEMQDTRGSRCELRVWTKCETKPIFYFWLHRWRCWFGPGRPRAGIKGRGAALRDWGRWCTLGLLRRISPDDVAGPF